VVSGERIGPVAERPTMPETPEQLVELVREAMGAVCAYVGVEGAAAHLGVSVRTFHKMRKRRPGLRVFAFGEGEGAHPRYRRDDLDAWAEGFAEGPAPKRRKRRPARAGRLRRTGTGYWRDMP